MNAQQNTPTGMTPAARKACADGDLVCRLKKVVEGGPAAIDERLEQLDREWTSGRAAKATAGGLIIVGFVLTILFANPWWLILPAVGGFAFLQTLVNRQTVLGWFYHDVVGLRSSYDIDKEKLALRTLRGDFQHLPTVHQVVDPDSIARLEGEGGIVVEDEEAPVLPEVAIREVLGAAHR